MVLSPYFAQNMFSFAVLASPKKVLQLSITLSLVS